MHKSMSSAETPLANQYIRKLCKHFAHKIDVSYQENVGNCAMPKGNARMVAEPEKIIFQLEAIDLEGLEQTQAIIEDHFIRVAYKEKIKTLVWQNSVDD